MPATTYAPTHLARAVPSALRGLTSVSGARLHPPLTLTIGLLKLSTMEVNFSPETESRLQELATKTGRAPNDLIEDAMAGYLQELAQVCGTLDGRK